MSVVFPSKSNPALPVSDPADDDGLRERLAARQVREQLVVNPQTLINVQGQMRKKVRGNVFRRKRQKEKPKEKKKPKRGGGGGFFFFGRKPDNDADEDTKEALEKMGASVGDALAQNADAPVNSGSFGGLYESRVYDFVAEAIERKEQFAADSRPELQTVLPYDLQRALFDELIAAPHPSPVDAALAKSPIPTAPPAKRNRTPVPPEEPKKDVPLPLRVIGDVLSAVSWVRGNRDVEESEQKARKKKAGAAAYAVALTRDMDMQAADDALLSDSGAAAAFATAAAIATSSTNTGLDAIEEAGLNASVSAARAVTTVQDARVFVETVGVGPLVSAARILNGTSQSAALTALANIAIMLPTSRVDMLTADSGALVDELMATVRGPNAFTPARPPGGLLARTEALVSGTHLIGSLALAAGSAGREWRLRMAGTPDLIRDLRRLAGGLKNGEPEGAARAARRALGALGVNEWRPRVPGQRGLRILSIDGGGTRAIMAFEMLKHLKRITGCEIHEMFDIIGGTSTGAIVAASLGMAHKSVEEVELLYRDMIGKIFAKHPVNGPKMLLTRAYYDTNVLETTLKRECGKGVFIDSLAEESMNKVFVVSSIMSRSPQELHVFRNYTYPPGNESRYDGTVEAQLWEALRASSAAPTFFSEIRVNGELHADGAIVANNPTAVALHETKCMYPGVPIELLVSMGNGLSPADVADVAAGIETGKKEKEKNMGWGDVVGSIVASATSTETVHHALLDLFPSDKYFRFNPVTDSTQIDETRPDQLALFVKDSKDYIAANGEQFETVGRILRPKTPRSLWRRFRDALREEIQVLQTTMNDDLYLPNNPKTTAE